MTAADDAYRAAQRLIAEAKADGATKLSLDTPRTHALTSLPSEISEMTAITELTLYDTQITDLEPVRELTNLTTLMLVGTLVTDLAPIRGITGINSLGLGGTQITDLNPIRDMTRITRLTLGGTRISDLDPIRGMTGMTTLDLNNTQVADLGPIRHLTEISWLDLRGTQLADLEPLRDMTRITWLGLGGTQITGLDPIRGMVGMTTLGCGGTQIADLSPIGRMTEMVDLYLDHTEVIDLRPLRALTALGKGGAGPGITLTGCRATKVDPRIAQIAEVANKRDRIAQLMTYLEDWEPPAGERQHSFSQSPVTVAMVLEAQDQTGWRFSPQANALELFVQHEGETAQQARLADVLRPRIDNLLSRMRAKIRNSDGIHRDVLDGAQRFSDLLRDDTRALGDKALDFWASSIGLGSSLEANDAMVAAGRDPLDCLRAEERAALQTFLDVAAGFVRAFPDAREMDEAASGFKRTTLKPDLLRNLLSAASDLGLIDAASGRLVLDVADLATKDGLQAEKAHSVTSTGSKNLIVVTAMLGGASYAVVEGIGSDVGADISDHYEISEKAIKFIDSVQDEIAQLIEGLSPDEKVNLREVLRKADRRRGR